MKCTIDAAIFANTVVVFGSGIFPAGFKLRNRKLVWAVAVNFVGAEKNEGCFGTMEASGFEQIDCSKRVHFKIYNGYVPRLVVRRLCGAVDDQIERLRSKERFEGDPVADV